MSNYDNRDSSNSANRPAVALERVFGKGAFFIEDTLPYREAVNLLGQAQSDSCVAACCRMVLKDLGQRLPEAFIRDAVKVELGKGASLKNAEAALKNLGVSASYRELSIDELRRATDKGLAIVFVKTRTTQGFHAIIVDGFEGERVKIRDPLPEGEGSAYKVATDIFALAWNRTAVLVNQ